MELTGSFHEIKVIAKVSSPTLLNVSKEKIIKWVERLHTDLTDADVLGKYNHVHLIEIFD